MADRPETQIPQVELCRGTQLERDPSDLKAPQFNAAELYSSDGFARINKANEFVTEIQKNFNVVDIDGDGCLSPLEFYNTQRDELLPAPLRSAAGFMRSESATLNGDNFFRRSELASLEGLTSTAPNAAENYIGKPVSWLQSAVCGSMFGVTTGAVLASVACNWKFGVIGGVTLGAIASFGVRAIGVAGILDKTHEFENTREKIRKDSALDLLR